MKTIPLFFVTLLLAAASVQAQSTFMDKVRRAFDNTKDSLGSAAQNAGRASKEWLNKAKENLRLSRPEYTKRAEQRVIDASVATQRIKQGKSGVMQRKYFQARLAALEQHVAYAQLELDYIKAAPTEEVFRERQRGFDFTLWSLEEAIALSEAEADL